MIPNRDGRISCQWAEYANGSTTHRSLLEKNNNGKVYLRSKIPPYHLSKTMDLPEYADCRNT